MKETLTNREYLIASGNYGILKDLLPHAENYNTLWGPEYIIMNEKNFIDNNANAIVEMMVKIRTSQRPSTV